MKTIKQRLKCEECGGSKKLVECYDKFWKETNIWCEYCLERGKQEAQMEALYNPSFINQINTMNLYDEKRINASGSLRKR